MVVPEGGQVQLAAEVSERSGVGRLLGRLAGFGLAQRTGFARGLTVSFAVRYGDPNASLAYFLVRGLREALEAYAASERSLLSRVGFRADEYLSDVDFAILLLRESEGAFRSGDFEVGGALLERGLAKAASSLDSLSQVKSDSVPSFLFLLTFTLFLSLILGNLAGRGAVAALVFAALVTLELALIPYARVALTYLDPSLLRRAPPSSTLLALVVAVMGLAVVAAFVLGARGTALSDLFWYSVKSMRERKLRALLTVATVAAVTSAASAFLALGTVTVTRVEAYPSSFEGLSVSRHLTVSTYIFRGMDQANEYVVTETYLPLTPGEVKWLSSLEWVRGVYVVEVGRAPVSSGAARALALVVATNATRLSGAAVSSSLAARLNVTPGSTIYVAGRPVRVEAVFDDGQPPAPIDGAPLAEVSGAREVVVVPAQLAPPGAQVYRVLLAGEPPAGFRDQLVRMSYVWSGNTTTQGGAQVTTFAYESYRACRSGGGSSECAVIVGEFAQAAAVPEFAIVLLLSALSVAVSLLGSMHERWREYSTASALGASPAYVSAIVLVEGMSYGVLGGVAGFILGQFLQGLMPRALAVKPSPLSPVLASILVAIVPSVIGSALPARGAALRVVPSRMMLRKAAEVRIYEDMAEAYIPLRITGDAEEFARYVSSLVNRPPPLSWGPLYMRATVRRREGRVEEVELLVSFRSERAAMYVARVYVPRRPGETVRVVASSATGEWTVDHKACAQSFLTALRDDLLRYIEWKKKARIQA